MNLAKSKMIFLDTAVFIYYFEDDERYAEKLHTLFIEADQGRIQLMTSLITYIEIITKPVSLDNQKLADKYRAYFTGSKNLSLLPLTVICAEETARIRCKYKFKTPDAIQIATALTCGADCVITNDIAWKRVSEIPVFCMDDL